MINAIERLRQSEDSLRTARKLIHALEVRIDSATKERDAAREELAKEREILNGGESVLREAYYTTLNDRNKGISLINRLKEELEVTREELAKANNEVICELQRADLLLKRNAELTKRFSAAENSHDREIDLLKSELVAALDAKEKAENKAEALKAQLVERDLVHKRLQREIKNAINTCEFDDDTITNRFYGECREDERPEEDA